MQIHEQRLNYGRGKFEARIVQFLTLKEGWSPTERPLTPPPPNTHTHNHNLVAWYQQLPSKTPDLDILGSLSDREKGKTFSPCQTPQPDCSTINALIFHKAAPV
jgi:hypothetical protein